jgi:hypothetical protein
VSLRPPHDRGHEHRDDWCVVQEGRGEAGDRHQTQQGSADPTSTSEELLREQLERTRLAHRAGQHEQRSHRDDARIRESGERILRCDDPREDQHNDGAQNQDVRGELLEDEAEDHKADDPEGDRSVPPHSESPLELGR